MEEEEEDWKKVAMQSNRLNLVLLLFSGRFFFSYGQKTAAGIYNRLAFDLKDGGRKRLAKKNSM